MVHYAETSLLFRRDRFESELKPRQVYGEAPLLIGGSRGPSWLATSHAEVRQVLGDSDGFSSLPPATSNKEAKQLVAVGNLLQHDPPEHTELRRLLRPEFTMHRMRRMVPRTETIVAELLDAIERKGPPADLMQQFAWRVPGLVMCDLLGVPRDDQADVARLLDAHSDGAVGANRQRSAGEALDVYFNQLAAQQHRNPGFELLGMLVREQEEHVTQEMLAGLAATLMAGGFENTSSMLGTGILALLAHPDQLALMRSQPELIDRAVEELLRYLSIITVASPRVTVRDVSVNGQEIPAGQQVTCSLFAANRDPAFVGQPDRLDVTRTPAPHVAFGAGIHYCVGAPLARMVLRVSYLMLLDRFPDLALAVHFDEIRIRPWESRVYGVESIPVIW